VFLKVEGPLGLKAIIQSLDDRGSFDIVQDIAKATLALFDLLWSKRFLQKLSVLHGSPYLVVK